MKKVLILFSILILIIKELGFSYCGPVTIYSFMQAAGMVNDHLVTCPNFLKCQSD